MSLEKTFTKELVRWGKLNKRNFPWRVASDNVYNILIAEVFLKRTTASHVLKIYEQFLQKYPDLASILSSNVNELETHLKPLGLQRQRTNQLIEMSNYIINRCNSKIPKHETALLKIPGIGHYSARAIQSFAFNVRSYPIDSNIQRIFSRVFIQENWKKASNVKIEEVFKAVQPIRNFKNFNYYLLDFGSLICRPTHPKCLICPVSLICISNDTVYDN